MNRIAKKFCAAAALTVAVALSLCVGVAFADEAIVGEAFSQPVGEESAGVVVATEAAPAKEFAAGLTAAKANELYAKGSLGFFEYYNADAAISVLSKKGTLEARTNIGAKGDATSLANLKATVQWLKKCNDLRASEKVNPTNKQPLNPLVVSMELMAISQVQCNWSAFNVMKHAMNEGLGYPVGENLAWGYRDPFTGWYNDEKAIYQSGKQGVTGHYLAIVNASYKTTGFAVCQQGQYPVTHEQSFHGAPTSGAAAFDVATFEKMINDYCAAIEKAAGHKFENGTCQLCGAQTVYRLYNKDTGEHLWTTDKNEYDVLPRYGWTQEGAKWTSPASGTGVYRLFNPGLNDHHYTSDTNETKVLTSKYGWVYDNNAKPLFYTGSSGKPIYRLYNGDLKHGQHLLTFDKNEYDVLPRYGWTQEGVKMYAL